MSAFTIGKESAPAVGREEEPSPAIERKDESPVVEREEVSAVCIGNDTRMGSLVLPTSQAEHYRNKSAIVDVCALIYQKV